MSDPIYGIRRRADGFWWAGFERWSRSAAPARWFDSATAANLAAVHDDLNDDGTWSAEPIPESAY